MESLHFVLKFIKIDQFICETAQSEFEFLGTHIESSKIEKIRGHYTIRRRGKIKKIFVPASFKFEKREND